MLTIQQLPSSWARFCLDVGKNWQENLPTLHSSHLLLALSGGSDSTALAILSSLLKLRLNLTLSACTINHGLRSEACAEVLGVKKLCQNLNIPCETKNFDTNAYAKIHKIGIEEAARHLRYSCLEEEREKIGADYIATAHQLDDLAEDMLMRLIRGAGWPKLAGMPIIDQHRHLIRPLLFTRAKILQEFLQDLDISWFTDQSNFDLSYTRNRIRHTIVPLFLSENPNFPNNVANLWQMAALDNDFWSIYLDKLLQTNPLKVIFDQKKATLNLKLDRSWLLEIHPAARLRLYKIIFNKLYSESWLYKQNNRQECPQISAPKLFQVDKLLQKGIGGKKLTLINSLTISFVNYMINFELDIR
ncbi:MAG: tRNA lysidine(34) synthetase TilS [Desulfovibrionaceae bacterium]|nr:tRNA lysidine(34) synthetase TilS [Desulfovibrionaceae bacterium]